jgi:hypothetical protein
MIKLNSRKSQLAMETIMIYGFVIVIVMLAIGALMYFGVMDLGALLPDNCQIKGGDFQCEDFFFSHSKGLKIQIANRAGKPVGFVISDDCDYYEVDAEAGAAVGADKWRDFSTGTLVGGGAFSGSLGNGQSVVLEAPDTETPYVDSGQKTKVHFKCDYTVAGSGITRSFRGQASITVGD